MIESDLGAAAKLIECVVESLEGSSRENYSGIFSMFLGGGG